MVRATASGAGFHITHNSCPSALAAGSRCSITVEFDARHTGFASGRLVLTNNGIASPQTARLFGFAF